MPVTFVQSVVGNSGALAGRRLQRPDHLDLDRFALGPED